MTLILEHDVDGSGSPVLLLHSGVCDRRMWDPQWHPLGERHRTVRCDLRGFGETPLPAQSFDNRDDVIVLLDHLGIERTSLVGSSFGGRVALEVSAAHPERVDRLALLCPAVHGLPTTDDVQRFGVEEDALLEAGDIDAAVRLNVETWLGPEASEDTRALVYEMQRHAFEVQLASPEVEPGPPSEVDLAAIEAPALVVSGGHDLHYFRVAARHLVETMPRARHVELDRAGHLPSLERPAEATALLVEFLNG
ncbi:MAG: alpha/beta fold hydrolase [Actinomycetota bacterium]